MSPVNPVEEIRRKANARKQQAGPATSPAPAVSPKKKVGPVAYYDCGRNGYWTTNARGEWTPYTEASLRRLMKYTLFHEVQDKDLQYALLDKKLIDLQQHHDVAYAGPIAGYVPGLHDICGQRILVTTGPKLLTPKDGKFPKLGRLLDQLLGDNQRVFFAWMKCALRALYAGPPFRPGQMMAIAGPAGCGKSLLQNLITEMLGGRSAKPYRYMIGDTAFNSDLFQNEHLMIEDEAASHELRVRRHFGSQLKTMIANEVQSLHRKGRDALSMSVYWRITVTLNDEPENLMVLPPVDESLKDKIILLRAMPATFPYGKDDIPGRRLYRMALSDELPAFLAFLKSFRIPERMLHQRYGCDAFQDDVLFKDLEELAPEAKLMNLIDNLRPWGIDNQPFVGSAADLENLLLDKDKNGRVKSLLYFSTACGTYLARLRHRFPERVKESRSVQRSRMWQIKPPNT
jgi:energy-coupling factor transporter ATP-binding protein EcfA2